MKVLCNYTDCGPSYVRTAWAKVFTQLGHTWRFWRPVQESAFDVFSEYEPDLLIGTTYELDRATCKNVAARPSLRVLLYASAWGPYLKDVDLKRYPLVVTAEQEKGVVEKLRRETGRPDAVFIHAHGRWLDGTMSGWSEIGVPYFGALNAADVLSYSTGLKRAKFECDASLCGGYWSYKARNLDPFVLPLCHPSSGLSVKLFGNQPWPVHNYLGGISQEDERDLYASSTVCMSVSEPHSTDACGGWDCIERPFKTLAAGGFCVSDYVEEMADLFDEHELPMCKTAAEFHHAVRHYANRPDERLPFMAAGRNAVLADHTYHHRVADMFRALGMGPEAERCMASLATLLKDEH